MSVNLEMKSNSFEKIEFVECMYLDDTILREVNKNDKIAKKKNNSIR